MRYWLSAVVLLVLVSSSPRLHAEEGQVDMAPDARLEGLTVGTVAYGAPIELEDLRGKVVMHAVWSG
jgi:hypothetical protein